MIMRWNFSWVSGQKYTIYEYTLFIPVIPALPDQPATGLHVPPSKALHNPF
jgi:hypothetical protein